MLAIFIISAGVLLYIFLGYPVALVVISELFEKRVGKADAYPSVSLIISAYNEAEVIGQKIENSLSLDYPKEKLEIIVASESEDGTNDIVRQYEERGVVLYAFEGRRGKANTLYRTVPNARGEIIVFSDANSMYSRNAVRKLAMNFADERVGCVSGRLKYVNPSDSNIGEGESAYWGFELFLKKRASRIMSLAGGVNGSIFAIRKELYSPINEYRGDDFELSNRIEIDGHGVVLEPEAVAVEEVSETPKQEFKRKVRLASWNLRSTAILFSEALRRRRFITALMLFSHRLLRYTTPVWLIALLASNAFLLDGVLAYALHVQVGFYLFAAAGIVMDRIKRGMSAVFVLPFYFCMLNCAALLALARNVTGRTDVVWEKSR